MTIQTAVLALAAAGALLAQDTHNIVVEQRVGARIATDAGMAGASTFEFVAGELAGGEPVKGAPYSAQAVTQTTQTLADGNRIVRNSSSMLYRDGEGRERRELSLPNIGNKTGEPAQPVFISDPVAGTNYTLDTKNHIAMKMPPRPPLPKGMVAPKGRGGDVMFQSLDIAGSMIPNVIGAPP